MQVIDLIQQSRTADIETCFVGASGDNPKARRSPMRQKKFVRRKDVIGFVEELLDEDIHAKRVLSLANATVGVLTSTSLSIHAIGHGLAYACDLTDKHAIKQVDRMLSNRGIVVEEVFPIWISDIIGERKEIVVILDWTDFDQDDHATLELSLVTSHGRATPLMWKTVEKSELKGQKQQIEGKMVMDFALTIPDDVQVTLLADRGFDDHKFLDFIQGLKRFEYVIRFRGRTKVTNKAGESRAAKDWVGKGGRAKTIRDARLTRKGLEVATIVCVHDKKMKDAWCLASNKAGAMSKDLVKYYARRWSIEAAFRDLKDPRYGFGFGEVRISRPERRDRILLLRAFSVVLLTLLGAAGEDVGIDRHLKANTTTKRTLSLLRQGHMWYRRLDSMRDEWFDPLVRRYGELIQQYSSFKHVFEVV